MNNKALHMVAFILLVVGGVNWLLVAFGYNLVELILGSVPTLEKAVYVLVGLAAIYEVATHKKNCRQCEKAVAAAPGQGDMTHG